MLISAWHQCCVPPANVVALVDDFGQDLWKHNENLFGSNPTNEKCTQIKSHSNHYAFTVDCYCLFMCTRWLCDITTDEFVRKLPRHRKCKTYVLTYSLVKLLRCHTYILLGLLASFFDSAFLFYNGIGFLCSLPLSSSFFLALSHLYCNGLCSTQHHKCCLRSVYAMLTPRIGDLLVALNEIKCKQKRIFFLCFYNFSVAQFMPKWICWCWYGVGDKWVVRLRYRWHYCFIFAAGRMVSIKLLREAVFEFWNALSYEFHLSNFPF